MKNVFNVYSRLQAPLTNITDAIENNELELPAGIDELDLKHVNGKLQIVAVPTDDSVNKYTPSAKLKGSLEQRLVVVEDNGELTHESVSQYEQGGWQSFSDDDEGHNTEEIEYINFYGHEDDVLLNSHLRAEMFEVLCQLTEYCVKGFMNGIAHVDDELAPVWYEAGGEQTDAELSIDRVDKTTQHTSNETETTANSPSPNWAHYS